MEAALRLALVHLRRNCTCEELGEDVRGVSTAWDYVQLMIQFLADIPGRPTPAAATTPTRCRGDLSRINTVITPVTGLQMLNERFSGRRLTFDRIARAQLSE